MGFQSIINGARSKGEGMVVGLVNKTLANPKFTRFTVKAMEATLWVKPSIDKNLQFAYKSMNLASRADFDNLAAKVSELSRKQGVLDAEIEKLGKRIDKNQ